MTKFFGKICFLMPTVKNRFQILNLHPKNIYFKNKSTSFFNEYKVKKKIQN